MRNWLFKRIQKAEKKPKEEMYKLEVGRLY